MSIDNTHTKYLKGHDKKVWNNYADALKAQNKLEGFIKSIGKQKFDENGEYDVPVRKNNKKNNKKTT